MDTNHWTYTVEYSWNVCLSTLSYVVSIICTSYQCTYWWFIIILRWCYMPNKNWPQGKYDQCMDFIRLKSQFPFFGQNFVFDVDKFQSRKIFYLENLSLKRQLVLEKLQKQDGKWCIFLAKNQKIGLFSILIFFNFLGSSCLWRLKFSE